MTDKVKIIANYLPQFHETEENNLFWGKGFTDWVGVKKAVSQYDGHKQPRIPLNRHYYDLSNYQEIKWQAELAKKYGVYGFGIYHYWFSSAECYLDTPPIIIREHADIDIHYMFIWDNNSWKRSWDNIHSGNAWLDNAGLNNKFQNSGENGLLVELKYGNEDEWKAHFNYLLPFFQDSRYIRVDGKPMIGLMNTRHQGEIDTLKKMFSYWNELALKSGLPGIYCMVKQDHKTKYNTDNRFIYEPFGITNYIELIKRRHGMHSYGNNPHKLWKVKYETVWSEILIYARFARYRNLFFSGFVGFDDTPRRGNHARIIIGQTPEKFRKYMTQLLDISKKQKREYVFLIAWNEWGEGAYLEPDEENKYEYLEALKQALINSDNF